MHYQHIKVTIHTPQERTPTPLFFMGSALRGAFGYALKRVVCINPSYECKGCFTSSSCIYHDFYEAQNSYHSYRFETELGSRSYSFGLYLFEQSCDKLPYVVSALHRMLTEVGLTRDTLKFEHFTIEVNGSQVYDGVEFALDQIEPQSFDLGSRATDITLTLRTPLRIKKNNRFLREDIELTDILRSIHQRERELVYGESYAKLEYTPSYTTLSKQLHYKTLIRKSNRQKSRMYMDGMIGEFTLTDLDPTSYRLLKLGEILGVGKQTVMGLGSIRLT